ncbi:cardiolipin synthase [Microvirga guangxiensis]|uniref:Cardiolipin synthase n=1 Tax=Microvirga guangxiensis TaxID=549386 RepID=A0A1G5IQJ5_9HYPH|nr:cardiolipin synthase [Microvirga guangxiensis]SCY78020.1 cardiolipin synthase [Microvirga guangxiensis]
MTWTAALGWFFAAYALLTGIFLLLENRRPQATLAWMLLFLTLPGIGLAVYALFGRDRKAFGRQRKLARQNLQGTAAPIVEQMLARQDAEIGRLETQSPARRRLMSLVRRNSHSALTTRNHVAIQQNASAFYPSLMEDMRKAQRTIYLQFYTWADDAFTRELQAILLERAAHGVEVHLLYDPFGSLFRLTRRYRRELSRGGVRWAPVSALYWLHTISYRNHRKIAVIDGKVGYTGGMNIGQEHIDGGEGFDSWRDTQVRLEGEAAAVLQAVFMVDWYNATGEDLFAADRFPSLANGLSFTPTENPEVSDGYVPVQILTSGPDSEWRAIRQLYFAMIMSAQQRVRLQSPFFVLDATIAEALRAAALAGIAVEVMVSDRGEGLNQTPYWAANTYLAEVAAAGAQVHMYGKGYLHAKTLSIDGEACSIGSANLDIRSFSINYELNAVIYDAGLTQELEEAFERDLRDCYPFDANAYRRRSGLIRLRDSTARLLSPLL